MDEGKIERVAKVIRQWCVSREKHPHNDYYGGDENRDGTFDGKLMSRDLAAVVIKAISETEE